MIFFVFLLSIIFSLDKAIEISDGKNTSIYCPGTVSDNYMNIQNIDKNNSLFFEIYYNTSIGLDSFKVCFSNNDYSCDGSYSSGSNTFTEDNGGITMKVFKTDNPKSKNYVHIRCTFPRSPEYFYLYSSKSRRIGESIGNAFLKIILIIIFVPLAIIVAIVAIIICCCASCCVGICCCKKKSPQSGLVYTPSNEQPGIEFTEQVGQIYPEDNNQTNPQNQYIAPTQANNQFNAPIQGYPNVAQPYDPNQGYYNNQYPNQPGLFNQNPNVSDSGFSSAGELNPQVN